MVREIPVKRKIRLVAGADISYDKLSTRIFTGVAVLNIEDLTIVETVAVRSSARFPYVPGLLSFREAPSVLAAWKHLKCKPDALLVDGQGRAHPRRFGIASHLGVLLEIPTIGCAKTILVGEHGRVPVTPGKWTPLIDRKETVGAVLRTKRDVAPIYISVGHMIDLTSAIDLAKRTTKNFRQPEPTRQAHLLVNRMRREEEE